MSININEILNFIYLKYIDNKLDELSTKMVVGVIFGFYYINKNHSKINKIDNHHGAGMLIYFGGGNNFSVQKPTTFNVMNLYFFSTLLYTIENKFLKNTNLCIILKECFSNKQIKLNKNQFFFKVIIIDGKFKIKYFHSKILPINFKFEKGMGFIGLDYIFLIKNGLQVTCIS